MEEEEHLLPMSDIPHRHHTAGWYKVIGLQIEAALCAANFSMMKNVPETFENKIPTWLK